MLHLNLGNRGNSNGAKSESKATVFNFSFYSVSKVNGPLSWSKSTHVVSSDPLVSTWLIPSMFLILVLSTPFYSFSLFLVVFYAFGIPHFAKRCFWGVELDCFQCLLWVFFFLFSFEVINSSFILSYSSAMEILKVGLEASQKCPRNVNISQLVLWHQPSWDPSSKDLDHP